MLATLFLRSRKDLNKRYNPAGLGVADSIITSQTSKASKSTRSRSKKLKHNEEIIAGLPDGVFLPCDISSRGLEDPNPRYGYLSYERRVVLDIEQVSYLVEMIATELERKGGISTPFLFSTAAIDLSKANVEKLINSFLDHLTSRQDKAFKQEIAFAGPHQLGMFLRWILARPVYMSGGMRVHGLLSWQHYGMWKKDQLFSFFVSILPDYIRPIITRLFTLLARVAAHSSSTGHTPPSLAAIFGPLLFGLTDVYTHGAAQTFQEVYSSYIHSATAIELLFIAFLREQDTPILNGPGSLKKWINTPPGTSSDYEISSLNISEQVHARHGVRTSRLITLRRNVSHFSHDFLAIAPGWARSQKLVPDESAPPQYSSAFCKRVCLSSNNPGGELYRSMSEMRWGEFESVGFCAEKDAVDNSLKFDLNESLRKERLCRSQKHQSMTWNDFGSSGFSRMDEPLQVALQFSSSLQDLDLKASESPKTRKSKLSRPLKAKFKNMRQEPIFLEDDHFEVGEVEEPFIDVYCDLICSSGFGFEYGCHWAVAEFDNISSPYEDENTVVLFEEHIGTRKK